MELGYTVFEAGNWDFSFGVEIFFQCLGNILRKCLGFGLSIIADLVKISARAEIMFEIMYLVLFQLS